MKQGGRVVSYVYMAAATKYLTRKWEDTDLLLTFLSDGACLCMCKVSSEVVERPGKCVTVDTTSVGTSCYSRESILHQ